MNNIIYIYIKIYNSKKSLLQKYNADLSWSIDLINSNNLIIVLIFISDTSYCCISTVFSLIFKLDIIGSLPTILWLIILYK